MIPPYEPETAVMSRTSLFQLLNEARSIGRMEARPLRPSTDHITEMGVQERWGRLISDARSTLRPAPVHREEGEGA